MLVVIANVTSQVRYVQVLNLIRVVQNGVRFTYSKLVTEPDPVTVTVMRNVLACTALKNVLCLVDFYCASTCKFFVSDFVE